MGKGGKEGKSKRRLDNDDDDETQNCGTTFYENYFRPLAAECFGTAILVFLGTMSVVPTMLTNPPNLAVGYAAIGHGLTLVFLCVAFGSVSGAHVNPAITIAAMVSGATKIGPGIVYILAQAAGAIGGAALTRAVLPDFEYSTIDGGYPELTEGILKGTIIEGILTFILTLTFLVSALEKSPLAAIAIGFAMFLGVLIGAPYTGGMLNPARALGPGVVLTLDGTSHWENHWIYWVGPIVGALIASFLYRFVLAGPERRAELNKKYE